MEIETKTGLLTEGDFYFTKMIFTGTCLQDLLFPLEDNDTKCNYKIDAWD